MMATDLTLLLVMTVYSVLSLKPKSQVVGSGLETSKGKGPSRVVCSVIVERIE